ncbi:hypothetical protein RQP46_004347 [Phenoliferia psychrophenolica]
MSTHRPGYVREDSLGNIPLSEIPIAPQTTKQESISSKASLDAKSEKDYETPAIPTIFESEHEDLETDDIDDKHEKVMETAHDFSTKLKSIEVCRVGSWFENVVADIPVCMQDDPTLPVWTFRMWFLGVGFVAFAAVLGQIYYFRPQTVYVSSLFITVRMPTLIEKTRTLIKIRYKILSFVLGNIMAATLPGEERLARFGPVGRQIGYFLNPGPFNVKEHVAIQIMSSTAVSSATAISVFATDELYYNIEPNYGVAIFALIGSQLMGYGLAGLCRSFAVYPTYALWPSSFAYTQLFETLHSKHVAGAMKKRWRFFWILLAIVFIWTLTGVSIFCLAMQNSAWVTRIFGGANGNEGFGVFSMSFDWYYVGSSPFYTPLITQMNSWFGIGLCILINCLCYSQNLWKAKNFPWLSQSLFYENGSTYDQLLILDQNYNLNQTALDIQGVPYFTMTNALYYLGNYLAIGAQFSYVGLFYNKQIREAWHQFRTSKQLDPHYQKMLVYKEVPMWWYAATFLGAFACAMATAYTGHSHLPWWALIVAILLSSISMPFTAMLNAVTGFSVGFGDVAQLIGGEMLPGNPQTNLWFTLYGSTLADQGVSLLSDLKLGQYMKLPPRVTFTVQMLGSTIGGILQIIITKTSAPFLSFYDLNSYLPHGSVIANQRAILLSIEGTNIWNGQNVQSYVRPGPTAKESMADAARRPELASHRMGYGSGSTYYIVPICLAIGFLISFVFYGAHRLRPTWGFDQVLLPSQMYIRRKHPGWFRKYNVSLLIQGVILRITNLSALQKYLMCGAIDGGYQFMSFIATFAVQGGAGTEHPFPSWALNPASGNYDYCKYLET